MDGGVEMQISIVKYSEVIKISDFRLDAECYKQSYINIENLLLSKLYTRIGNEVENFSKGAFDIKAECYFDEGIPFIRISNLKEALIEKNGLVYISEEENKKYPNSILNRGDIVISKTAYPAASLVTEDIANASQDIIAVKLKSDAQISSSFLTIFLNTKYGFSQMCRWFTGNIQMHLNLKNSKEIIVPVFSNKFFIKIDIALQNRIDLFNQSKKIYQQAEDLLLTELGLNDWQPKHQLTFVKRYADIQQAERMDADYYQPKYDAIIHAIKNYSGGYSTIRQEFKQNKTTFEIDDKKLYQYVEIGSINVSNGEITPSEVLGSDLPANAKRVLNKDDVIISKVRTYRGAITIVEKDDYIGSGAFTALTESGKLNKETLLAFFHSKPLLAWSLKPNTGTSYPVIVDDDILNLPIPLLPQLKQRQIQQKVQESFALRKQSKHLLECAKRAVEIAIEQNETKAMAWLKKHSDHPQSS